MPIVPEAVIAMLACARLGAIHSVVFGGLVANELALRINDAAPKAVISASRGIEAGKTLACKPLLDKAIFSTYLTPPGQLCKVTGQPAGKAFANEVTV